MTKTHVFLTRYCASCAVPIDSGRVDKRYCSDMCRQRAHRYAVWAASKDRLLKSPSRLRRKSA